MKRFFTLLLSAMLLNGCSFGEQEVTEKVKANDESGKKELAAKSEIYVPNPQVTDDSSLQKAGDVITDRKGELTLKSVKTVNEILSVEGVEYTIKDVKLLHYIPDYSLIDFYHPYTHEEEFDFVKLGIEVRNNTEELYHFAPIALLKVNGEQEKTWEDDFYLEELNGEISPGQVKKGNIGFIVDHLDELKEIEFISSDLVDVEHKKQAEPQKMTITFKQ